MNSNVTRRFQLDMMMEVNGIFWSFVQREALNGEEGILDLSYMPHLATGPALKLGHNPKR